MFNLKASFLLVLMVSVIYISSNSSDDDEDSEANLSDDVFEVIDVSSSDEQEEQNVSHSNDAEELNVIIWPSGSSEQGFTNCIMNMELTFKNNTHPLDCIKHAIHKMILYGEHKFTYECHVKLYYQSLYLFVNVDLIKIPSKFCTKTNGYDKTCHNELKIFEKEMSYAYNPRDYHILHLLDATMGFPYNFSGGTIYQIEEESSSSHLRNEKTIILKNALYYHRIGLPPRGHIFSDGSRKYFHIKGTNGARYMGHIFRAIRLISDDMDTPEGFCKKLYLKNLPHM